MVKVLIPTKPNDTDSIYVKFAIEKKGHECVLFYTADFPEKQVHTFELQNDAIHWTASGQDFYITKEDKFDVVWVRRPRLAQIPAMIHEDDVESTKNEYTAFYKTLWQVISPQAFWVNPVN